MNIKRETHIKWFEEITASDIPFVGGKNASLGEMHSTLDKYGINVPSGFATTSEAFWAFLTVNNLREQIKEYLGAYENGEATLEETGRNIRRLFRNATFPAYLAESIREAYNELSHKYNMNEADVAVRSSATAEDLPEASFAGQQETFLNIVGEEELLEACRKCYASLFTDRAIAYREEKGFDHMQIALSIGVQKMVRSDKAGSGVMFTIDTESGFPDIVLINASWGLGENVVKGTVNPDQYAVFKPLLKNKNLKPIVEKKLGSKDKKLIYASGTSRLTENVHTPIAEQHQYVLNDDEILKLSRWAVIIEEHYHKPMDIEWAKDGDNGEIFIVQARPETVQSIKHTDTFQTFKLKSHGPVLLTGLSIGSSIASGPVYHVNSVDDLEKVPEKSIIVTEMTEPDWVPAMQKIVGIITDFGGRTCHAAIVSRELGIPAIVGTGDATQILQEGQKITLSCAEGETGYVYDSLLDYEVTDISLHDISRTRTQIMINMATPEGALKWWRLPVDGIGLARMEFIIGNHIRIHPMALVRFDKVKDEESRHEILKLTRGYEDKKQYFVDHLARGIAKIACSQYPNPVIVRMSDFKTNEYADLIGGEWFEPKEENPMIGWRGASRYYSEDYKEGFALECQAVKKARQEIGLLNIVVMIPFCRTPEEADKVLNVMAENGLRRGRNSLEIYVMCEIPSNVILAEEFAQRFDGFSIGSNDLTQLVLGVDRDSSELAYLFEEDNEAVLRVIRDVIQRAHKAGCKVGFCGQAPSDNPEYAKFLVETGIDSISLNPDSVLKVIRRVASVEKRRKLVAN